MQLAKVVIASVLILAVHAERLPEGKICCIIMFTECKVTYCSCYAKFGYSKLINCGVLTSSLFIIGIKAKCEEYFIAMYYSKYISLKLNFECDV